MSNNEPAYDPPADIRCAISSREGLVTYSTQRSSRPTLKWHITTELSIAFAKIHDVWSSWESPKV